MLSFIFVPDLLFTVYQRKITKNEMNRLVANRRTYIEFGELTLRINMPDIPATKLNRQTINKIETFL
jgi:hypothetical protein